MKHYLILALGFLICGIATANPIEENPIFKLFIGEWTGEGELVDSDGHKTKVVETWTEKLTDEGSFVISGKRKFDMAEHDFAWDFYANGDLIEGQMKMSEPEVEQRFEVVINEDARSIEIKIPLGGGTTMTVKNTVLKDGKTIEGTSETRRRKRSGTGLGKSYAHEKGSVKRTNSAKSWLARGLKHAGNRPAQDVTITNKQGMFTESIGYDRKN
ncbi:MAG: hypothetical protein ACKVJU_20190 [Verrucomicrobiales bacterium]